MKGKLREGNSNTFQAEYLQGCRMSSAKAEYPSSKFGIPPLAGLCSMHRATQAKWSLDESVSRLKHLHYVLRRVHEVLIERITSQPIYELKTAMSYHAYLLAEHVTMLRTRVGEMREPPLGLENIPHPALKLLLDEVHSAPDTKHLLLAVYDLLLPASLHACEQLQREAHPLADAPTCRTAKLIAFELREIVAFGKEAIGSPLIQADPEDQAHSRSDLDRWLEVLGVAISAAGGIDGRRSSSATNAQPLPEVPLAVFSDCQAGWKYDERPRRDARFQDSYNAGVNPEAFLYDASYSPQDKSLMMYYKRIRELDVPEMMASILVELRSEEPWGFHMEMSRQLWDEARHAMMGEVGFASLGIDWAQIPINFTWSLNLNTQLTARERHGVLFYIEQTLMPKDGKRFEWEIAQESGDPLSAVFQDFDWADEVLHAQIGRRWYVPKFESLTQSLQYGDRCWSKVLSHWQQYRNDGLTEHRNWWPELYKNACEIWGKSPDPKALDFNETYEDQRADLKRIDQTHLDD